MKFLLLTGASRAVVWFRKELILHLIENHHNVTVVSCDNDNADVIKSYGADFYCVGSDNRDTGFLSNLKYVKKLKVLIKEINPDKVLTFQAKSNTFGIIASQKAGYYDIAAMVEGLGNVFNGKGLKNFLVRMVSKILLKKSLKKVKTVFFLNEDNKKRMIEMRLIKENQCVMLNGIGVDTKNFIQDVQPNLDTIKFVMVSRVELEKGVVEYCESAKKIIESGVKNVLFNFYGSCDKTNNIVDNYKGFVNNCGYTKDIKSALEQNHIIVLPSYHEGVPRSLMEACAMSKPIIATNISGCKVCVEDNVNGRLIKVKSVEDLIEKTKWFVENKDKILAMGRESRKIAENKFESIKINNIILERVCIS